MTRIQATRRMAVAAHDARPQKHPFRSSETFRHTWTSDVWREGLPKTVREALLPAFARLNQSARALSGTDTLSSAEWARVDADIARLRAGGRSPKRFNDILEEARAQA